MYSQTKLVKILKEEFKKRKHRNSSYSLRAFAKFLEIDQSTLSKFLKRDRNLTWQTMEKCLKKLEISADTVQTLKQSKQVSETKYNEISDELLTMLSEWSYWAILEYIKINPSCSVQEISKKLGLKLVATKQALLLMQELGFLKKQTDHSYELLKPNNSWIDTDKTSKARKQLQKKYLQMSLKAIDQYSIKDRQHGSLTVAIDKKRLPEIRNKINRFQRELGAFCQRKGRFSSVYQMQISFFPLTKVDE